MSMRMMLNNLVSSIMSTPTTKSLIMRRSYASHRHSVPRARRISARRDPALNGRGRGTAG